MKISRKAYYGLRAVVVLAQEKRQMSIHALAEAEGLPEDYLEKILQDLRRAGLVEAAKGSGGGYTLALEPKLITAGHILHTLDGDLVPFPCSTGSGACAAEKGCATSDVWRRLNTALKDTLDSITLADLIQ